MNEKQLLDRLKQDADTLTPPDSLSPDAIEQMLRSHGANNSPDLEAPRTDRKKQASFFRFAMRYGSLAAVFVLGVTVLWQANQISSLKENQARLPQENKSADLLTGTQKETQEETQSQANSADLQAEAAQNLVNTTDTETEATQNQMNAADTQSDTAQNQVNASDAQPETDALPYAASYEQIYDTLKNELGTSLYARDSVYEISEYAASDAEDSGDSLAGPVSSGSDVQTKNDFSQTNLQEAGVDEGDIVKTDGTYLYILKKDLTFSIIRADGSDLALCSTTSLDITGLSNPSAREIYLDGDTLTVLFDGMQTSLEQEDDVYYTASTSASVLCTYDLSDRNDPKLTGSVTQEGSYSTSRKVGNYLYLFTSYMPALFDTYASSTVAPRVNGTAVPATCFYLPEHPYSQRYLVITAIDLGANASVTDQKVLVSGADHFYVSPENIYIASENYSSDDTFTELAKFHYKNGQITGIAAGSVRGYLNNSFSLNEYDGYLRVVSTYSDSSNGDWTEKNALTILDDTLHPIGMLDNLASGETIQSARFLGNTGYFVTFRQTDPLFCVDLSDPENPKITDEQKLTGFSSYLHFYGDSLLLGIGYEADETTGEITGIKLSMFDLSDPYKVQEISRTVIPGITWAPAIEDYKSIFVDPGKNLIGFYCDGRYLVYSYDQENGFERILLYDFLEDGLMESVDYDTMRGFYIGDTLYLAGDGFVIPFDLSSGCKRQEIFRY